MLEEGIIEVIELVKNVAPEIWRIALLQVRTEIVQNAIFIVLMVIPIPILVKTTRYLYKRFKEELDNYPRGHEERYFLGLFFMGILIITEFIVLPNLISSVVARIINPEFYAIQLLLTMLGQ